MADALVQGNAATSIPVRSAMCDWNPDCYERAPARPGLAWACTLSGTRRGEELDTNAGEWWL